MIKTNLENIQKMCNGNGLNKDFYDIKILGVSTDTRNITKGNLFIPLSGENFDAHNFLQEAKDKGATAALVEKDKIDKNLDFPLIYVDDTLKALQKLAQSYGKKINPKVISITGSNGKTSTKDLLASILKTQYKTHKTIGNFNNHIGVPLTILDMDDDVEVAVIEMGISNFGEMDLLSSIINPDIGIITNIADSHLDELGTKENVAKAKMEFLKNLKDNGIYLYYKDDLILDKLSKNLNNNFKIISYGSDKDNDFYFENVDISTNGCSFYIPNISKKEFSIPLLGSHQVLNSTAAISVANLLGISDDNIIKGLSNVEATGMRNEIKKSSNYTILDDSYKSNPSSLKTSLDTLYSLNEYDQKIAVIGDMLGLGDGSENMHREIGKTIDTKEIDYLICIGPSSKFIAEEAKKRFKKDHVFYFEEKNNEIANKIKNIASKKSIIFVKASRALELNTIVSQLLEN